LLLGALDGRSKEQLLSSFFYPGLDRDYWHRQPLPGEIAEIANGVGVVKGPECRVTGRFDELEKQAHTGMVFHELSQGHREAVTEKLKSTSNS